MMACLHQIHLNTHHLDESNQEPMAFAFLHSIARHATDARRLYAGGAQQWRTATPNKPLAS